MKNKCSTLLALLLLVLVGSLGACDKFTGQDVVTVQTSEETTAVPAAVPSNDDNDVGESASTVTEVANTETRKSFIPQGTGKEPNPESSFALMTGEEQELFIAWLEQIAASYEIMGQSFDNFSSAQNVAVEEILLNLQESCERELQAIETFDLSALPDSTLGLRDAASHMNQWYKDFLSDLEVASQDVDNMDMWLEGKLTEAVKTMQAFLDALAAFTS